MSVADLKEEILHWKSRAMYAETALECFFTGSYPEGSDLTMVILGQVGKKRNEERKARAALLGGEGR